MEYLIGALFEAVLWMVSDLDWGGGDSRKSETTAPRVAPDGPCAYCRKRGGRYVTCRACRTPHHRDCAAVNGRCAVYGCANRKFLVPAA